MEAKSGLYGYEKVEILGQPTPFELLANISADMGVAIYCKRDDITPLASGGNKLRKLEYLVKDAMNKGATMLITEGGAQTNHGRLTAAAAAKFGLKCAIITQEKYPGEISANLLLDGMMDCPVYFTRDIVKGREALIRKYAAKGEKVYYIPMGGSNEIGMLGYVECARELEEQTKGTKAEGAPVYVTIGSMGTYMGLLIGFNDINSKHHVRGVNVLPYGTAGKEEESLRKALSDYYMRISAFYGAKASRPDPKVFDIDCAHVYGGYNKPSDVVRKAIYYMARREGIILDPCYTGKTFCGLLDDIRTGKIAKGSSVIFIHTGGLPGIYTGHHRVEFEKELMPYMRIEEV